ncbi:histidine phosphatase family protein [Umezawaea sp.]|uniref:histidine phosphatase family protein n=1 Tax=Umezawaea sp. TaxID=1955258 RepID=UPI002ED0D0ED
MTDLGWVGVVRHGESTGNVKREEAEAAGLDVIDIAERDADVPLSPLGEQQAAAVGRWLASLPSGRRPDVVVCSPYQRALSTAWLAVDEIGYQPVRLVDERLRDRELGVLDLLTARGVANRHPDELVRKERLGKFYYRPPGGESWADVALRLRSLLGDLERRHQGERVLLFAHEMTAYLLRYLLEGVPEKDLLALARNTVVANGSVTSWVREGSGFRLEHEHATEHLRDRGVQPTESEDAETESV